MKKAPILGLMLALTMIPIAVANSLPTLDTVYVTKSGDKYHSSTCRYTRKSKIAIDREQAKRNGYSACSVCKP